MKASYEDETSMKVALGGIKALFLVSGYGLDRMEQHYSAIDAAVASGSNVLSTLLSCPLPRLRFHTCPRTLSHRTTYS